MQVLLLVAALSQPVTPVCQQWLDRVDQESRYASSLVWSPRKERHIARTKYAAKMARVHCELAAPDTVAVQSEPRPTKKRGF